MWVEYVQTIKRFRGQIIGWGLGLALYSLMMVYLYGDIANMNLDTLLENYPSEILKFFGDSMRSLTSPEGYIDLYFFNYMTVIVGIFSVGGGAGLILKDEQEGKLDLILSYPRSRSAIFWGRVAGFATVLGIILLIAWASWVVPPGSQDLGLSPGQLLRPFLPLLCQLLFFGMLGLMLGLILSSVRLANMLTGGLLVANYLIVGLANINENLQTIVEYTPLYFYQGGYAVLGLERDHMVIVLEGAILFAVMAWERFLNRDLRVGGEGGLNITIAGWLRKKGIF